MFSRISRYRDAQDVAVTDADGRTLSAKALRVAATTNGQYQHTIKEGDRLDHLATHYYRQPRNWWLICDANPEILSPQDLLGAEPVVVYRFDVTAPSSPQWADLVRALNGLAGVVQAVLDGVTVRVTFNRLTVTVQALAAAMQAQGFTATAARQSGRTGKQIVIPPDTRG